MITSMDALEKYIERLGDILQRGDAREETYYPALETLVKTLSEKLGHQSDVTTLPKRTEAGNPDFRVWDGRHQVTGYIEAKKPDTNLDKIAETEQLKRYRGTFPNVILTDFFEFRLYKEGELVDKVSIGRPFVAEKLGEDPPLENVDDFLNLLKQFFSHSVPRTLRASSLAKELAKRTRFLEHITERELVEEENKNLTGFYKAFQQHLMAGLQKDEFADLYAQTVTYGLFAARTRADDTFTRENAVEFIPSTIGILKEVFQFISYGQLPENVRWIVDDIAEILNAADINQILDRYYEEGKGKDPIIHFYETFLSHYDPKLREQRGVYYTPEPVVGYIVRSVHQVLKEEFDKPLGLADSSVTVLDPAGGTLTFIAEAFKTAVNEYATKYGEGGVPELIRDHLMENFYAFELMMAPYAIGHLKMGFILEELGYELDDDERFNLYLTNTLEMEDLEQTELPGMASLSEESKAAGKVKKEEEVLVILGNPPYSVDSFNQSKKEVRIDKGDRYVIDWKLNNKGKAVPIEREATKDLTVDQPTFIGSILKQYYFVDGGPLDEKNPKSLQDDYVKFLRFAQWKINQTGQGIVGMITNHSYLRNPTFRGMRQSLMKTYDEISALDLHGDLQEKKIKEEYSDENIFKQITKGVAVSFFIKNGDNKNKVLKSDLYGTRKNKYKWLDDHHKKVTDWTEINPQSEFYLFTEQDYNLKKKYLNLIPLNNLFPKYTTGITTHRDDFAIDTKLEKLKSRISTFTDSSMSDELLKETMDLKESKTWKVREARKKLNSIKGRSNYYTKLLYRPFDNRNIFYHPSVIERGREEVMQHMMHENWGLVFMRQVSYDDVYSQVLVSNCLVDNRTCFSSKGTTKFAPLYLYPETDTDNGNDKSGGTTMMMVFEEDTAYTERRPNINKEFYALLENVYGERPTPEQILYYTYAVLYAPTYRQTYAEFLKSDFPRVPFTSDYELFCKLAKLGKELTELHLMKSDKLDEPIAKFQGKGSNVVAKPKRVGRNYKPEEERVYINKDEQYFEGIRPELWEYQVGGYQVLDKWLYDRRERKLSNEEVQHYCRVVTALYHTIQLQQEIDELYPGVEEEVVEWKSS